MSCEIKINTPVTVTIIEVTDSVKDEQEDYLLSKILGIHLVPDLHFSA